MVEFKICIGDKTGKTYQKEIKDEEAAPFMGLNIGEKINGETIGMTGYELEISGGSDSCGFPMRRGIQGVRKKITSIGGVGFAKPIKGQKQRKTVCGFKVNENISQINLKIVKEGAKKLADLFGGEAPKEGAEAPKAEEKPKEAPKAEEKPKEEKKEEAPKAEKKE
jgi:small subunit ribosomal protein S6e